MKIQVVIPPEEGWKAHTLYLVEASFGKTNPISLYYFHSGFLNGPKKTPGGYNEIFGTENFSCISDVVYLKVIKRLHTDGETKSKNEGRLVSAVD